MTVSNKHVLLLGRLLALVLIVSTLVVAILPAATIYAQDAPVAPPAQDTGQQDDGNADDGKSCAVEKVGWILCPIVESVSRMADILFKFLASSFLEVETELIKEESGTRTAWDQARNLANIMFVIAFIILIYSQVTGGMMSNYGIKRMLPRLIIAAIAVNASYYICQGMVDISNILGYEIKTALDDAGQGLPKVLDASDAESGSGMLGQIAAAILILGGVVWVFLALLGGAAGLVLITCLTIVIILLLRKAFIVLLIVLSPLAFVAYLLPNTEKYFKKWLNMFWQLLMVFPIVALLLGGGQLASGIILSAETKVQQQEQGKQDCPEDKPVTFDKTGLPECTPKIAVGEGKTSISMAIAAVVIAIAPLLFVWSVLKGALSATGAIGGKIATTIEKGGRGGMDNAKKMQKRYKESTFGQRRMAQSDLKDPSAFRLAPRDFRRRKHLRQAEIDSLKAEHHSREGSHLAHLLAEDEELAKRFAGGDQATGRSLARVQGRASSAVLKDLQEETQAQQAVLEVEMTGVQEHDLEVLKKAMLEGAKTGNHAMGNAAMNMLATRGEPGAEVMSDGIKTIDKNFQDGTWSATGDEAKAVNQMKANLTQSHSKLKGSHADINKWGKSGLATPDNPENTLDAIRANEGTYSSLTDEELATQKKLSLSASGASGVGGVGGALNQIVERVDKDGTVHSMARKARVASSEAGKEISGKTGSYFQ